MKWDTKSRWDRIGDFIIARQLRKVRKVALTVACIALAILALQLITTVAMANAIKGQELNNLVQYKNVNGFMPVHFH